MLCAWAEKQWEPLESDDRRRAGDERLQTVEQGDMYYQFLGETKDEYKLSSSADDNMFLGALVSRAADGGRSKYTSSASQTRCSPCANREAWKLVIDLSRKEITKELGATLTQVPPLRERRALRARVPQRVRPRLWRGAVERGMHTPAYGTRRADGYSPPKTQEAEGAGKCQEADDESKHSKSLPVARPDGQHRRGPTMRPSGRTATG